MTVVWWQVLAGAGLDLLLGDPRWLPHPVRGVGWLIKRLEAFLRWTGLPLYIAGVVLLLATASAACGIVWLTLPWAAVYWIWTLLAIRDLDLEATLVIRRLDAGDLAGARDKLALIVGRDTAALNEPEILRAAIETVAENLGDAVVAPLFWLAAAGPVGMAGYKAVNTLDSMVGYRNERYGKLGWASARFDDVLNFIPARLTALLVWLCALLLRLDAGRSIHVTLRDARTQPSPNSGYPEAAVAGAIGVQLGGLNYYRGVPSLKNYLGDAVRPLSRAAFFDARKLMYGTAALTVAAVCGVVR